MLKVSKIEKSYGASKVLRGIDFRMEEGERVAIMGPSGSGKSTLLNCIGGIDRPDNGEILFEGQSLTSLSEQELCELRRNKISTIFQFFHLLPTLTARENIEFPMLLNSVSAKERNQKVDDLLNAVKIQHRACAFPHELSGGEKQRVAIARSLSMRPKLILADEPTGNLDSKNTDSVLELIEKLSKQHGIAMLLVTHNEEVTRICDQTITMNDGLILSE
jgi:ABC-type lipoprotein export system ATPase subunit|tara:strand:+ start:258 stop:914 length:657 start_codon:yes stop_codon:yes gene_type:complete